MDNPLVYLGAGVILLVAGYFLGRVAAGRDRADRQSDEQRAAYREAMLRYIHDTRDQLLQLLELVEAVAAGDARRGYELAKSYRSSDFPNAYNELIADEELVHELTETMPAVMLRGWGKAKDSGSNARLRNIALHIRRAMREQELRVVDGQEPELANPDQRQRMNEAVDRVTAYIAKRGWRERLGAAIPGS